MIHVMAATGLGGAAMAAPVVGYDAIAVAEHDGLTFAPVLVVDLDVFGIFLTDSDVRHMSSPLLRSLKSVQSVSNGRSIPAAAAVAATTSSCLVASRFVDLLVELTTDALACHGKLRVIQFGG